MALTKQQKEQVTMQLRKHERDTVKASIDLGDGEKLELIVENGVFGSDIMSSGIYLSRFLYQNKQLYAEKTCLDVGCGAGTQGLVMAIYGAKQVDLADINQKAVQNTRANIKLHHLTGKCKAYESDLFRNLSEGKKYDFIVFNHPFFAQDAENFHDCNDVMLKQSMLGGTGLIKRFFNEVEEHLADSGRIIMPYFHFAGKENDPANHVEKYGLCIEREARVKSAQGLQLGDFSIYCIAKEQKRK